MKLFLTIFQLLSLGWFPGKHLAGPLEYFGKNIPLGHAKELTAGYYLANFNINIGDFNISDHMRYSDKAADMADISVLFFPRLCKMHRQEQ